MQDDIVILGGARTAIGTFGGSFAGTPPIDLATAATKAALERSGVEGGQVGHVVFGHVIQRPSVLQKQLGGEGRLLLCTAG